ncbi:Ldh family oxidoreductase [Halomonas halodenitrificans]|uniref:Ldh family oxidoreductase n=1 Tax=Halomonas halodenitrificans TaxID=28252 RepID=UPI000A026703|nr:Ldh family oxidoreductase [Halomonas halodenitrificans]
MKDLEARQEATLHLDRDALMALCHRVLIHHGFSEEQADALGRTLVAAQLDASHSHGIYRLLGIIDTVRKGGAVADAVPEVADVAPAVVRVDAKGGFSPCAFERGLPHLVTKARDAGIALLAINHCVHSTALWVELERLAEQGLVAIACNPTQAYVAPNGGKQPLLGTNPIAFGWPYPSDAPFIFDFATSTIARGDIELYRREGRAIPEAWGVDRHGAPCSDPAEVLDHGAMTTFGEHKGSALAIMIELMAGPLIGDLLSVESSEHDEGRLGLPYHGELIIAIDPSRLTGQSSTAHMERSELLFDAILGQGARLPSQRRYRERARSLAHGAEVSLALVKEIEALLATDLHH